jgi:tRNA(fMet)-specific endonuclease VapC
MLVLDTDILSIVQSRSGEAYRRLEQRLEAAAQREPIAVTIVTFEEQARGWLAQVARARKAELEVVAYQRLGRLLTDYCDRQVLEYDRAAIQRLAELRKARIRIGTMDMKIAAIVLSVGAKLLSRNLGDFRKVPGLAVEDWTAT